MYIYIGVLYLIWFLFATPIPSLVQNASQALSGLDHLCPPAGLCGSTDKIVMQKMMIKPFQKVGNIPNGMDGIFRDTNKSPPFLMQKVMTNHQIWGSYFGKRPVEQGLPAGTDQVYQV